MFRTIAVGSMCVALAALGAARSRAADEANTADQELVVEAQIAGAGEQATAGKALVESDGRLVEIQIGGDSANPDAVRSELRIDDKGTRTSVLLDKDGKIIERRVEAGPNRNGTLAILAGPQIADPEARAALEKLIAGLEEESKKLQAEGKAEEAQKKAQSLIALKQLLSADARVRSLQDRRIVYTRRDATANDVDRQQDAVRARQALTEQLRQSPDGQRFDGLKRLAARRHELAAEIAKVPEQDREQRALLGAKIAELDQLLVEEQKSRTQSVPVTASAAYYRTLARTAETDNLKLAIEKLATHRKSLGEQLAKASEADAEERVKLQSAIAEAERTIAELKQRLAAHAVIMPLHSGVGRGIDAPPTPQAPGIRFTAPLDATQPLGVPVLEKIPHVGRMFRVVPPELLALTQKVQALKQAADALTQAGMEDQARELKNTAEKIQKEIELRRAEMASRPDADAPIGLPVPPHELHRSIRELTEQVQQLRKEVAEVRELLQRRQ
jgi:hypothetical protein